MTLRYPADFEDAPDHPARGAHKALWVQIFLNATNGEPLPPHGLANDRFEVKPGGRVE